MGHSTTLQRQVDFVSRAMLGDILSSIESKTLTVAESYGHHTFFALVTPVMSRHVWLDVSQQTRKHIDQHLSPHLSTSLILCCVQAFEYEYLLMSKHLQT